nr:histidine-rich protein PFHRP-III-like [Crassostrea gigas]
MAKLTPFQKLKRAVSRLSVTSGSKFIQPDIEDSDIEFNANTYRPDFVSESRPDFASGSSKNYKNISQTSPPLFYSNDDLNFNYPSVVLNPHEASSSQAASFGGTTFPPFDRHEISRVPDPSDAHNATDEYNTPNANNINNGFNAPDLSDAHNAQNLPSAHNVKDGFNAPYLSDAHNAQNLPSAHNVKDGFNAPDPSDAHNAPNASQASKTSNPPQNLPRTSQEFVIPENTAANSQTAGKGLLPRLRRREFWVN